jgi:FkbM family methyltransferase
MSFDFAVVESTYATDYAGAVVLDLGAHKGYFGAYAVTHGARVVVAYEPESTNLAVLERTANGYGDADWTIRHAAVEAAAGRSELHVMMDSWAHSLAPPPSYAEYEVGLESVEVVALADAIVEAARLTGTRLVAKLNIEGTECSAILGTPASAWVDVDEVFVETHPWADCEVSELAGQLEQAGLTRVESAHFAVLRMRREGAPRGGRRTGPR